MYPSTPEETRLIKANVAREQAVRDRDRLIGSIRDINCLAAIDADDGDLAITALSEIRSVTENAIARLTPLEEIGK